MGYVLKVKVCVHSPDIPIGSGTLHQLPPGIKHSFTVSSPWGECSTFSAAVAIHTVPIFVPPGTHFCCVVDGGGVASKLAHDCHCGNRTPDP